MNKIDDTTKSWIIRNLVWAVVFVVGIILVTNISLSFITQHKKEITVPDLSNMTFQEAQSIARREGIRVQISDSVYVRNAKKGVVYAQNPVAGSKVKKGRRVLLTTNAVTPKKVTMPSLVGCSMRQAKAELASRGLVMGRFIYINDIATNNVLKQIYRNSEIRPGKTIDAGSSIDLVLGLNPEDSRTYAPNVVGLKYMRAIDVIRDNSLNVRRVVFDRSVKNYSDSLNAVVYDQKPSADGIPVAMGSEMTVYLKLDKPKTDN